MRVRNVHRRTIDAPDVLGRLLDGLGSDHDRLWPGNRWPPLRLDRPVSVGARGGHGPIRYAVDHYEPASRVRFRFERPRGFAGFHEFRVATGGERSSELVHVLEANMTGAALVSWPLLYRPLHDALIEDALDNAERAAVGSLTRSQRWTTYVRCCRRIAGWFAHNRSRNPNHESR